MTSRKENDTGRGRGGGEDGRDNSASERQSACDFSSGLP